MPSSDVDGLFKGQGFDRLVMAGGGVPRDFLSLFIEALSAVSSASEGDGRIGKDDVRILSRQNFENRIEELKYDCNDEEEDSLIEAIYIIRKFCLDRQTNIFMIRERELQQNDQFRALIYRLLDYRIVHSCADALTHKSEEGTYKAFAIDIGSYAHLRKLRGRFSEIDVSENKAKEKYRSSPILGVAEFEDYSNNAPENFSEELLHEEVA